MHHDITTVTNVSTGYFLLLRMKVPSYPTYSSGVKVSRHRPTKMSPDRT
jgi:hypothetical protein